MQLKFANSQRDETTFSFIINSQYTKRMWKIFGQKNLTLY